MGRHLARRSSRQPYRLFCSGFYLLPTLHGSLRSFLTKGSSYGDLIIEFIKWRENDLRRTNHSSGWLTATADFNRYLKNFLTTYALIVHIDTYRNRRVI